MALGTDELNRILVEVLTGKEPAAPDTPEMAEARASFQYDVEKARAAGHQIQIPNE